MQKSTAFKVVISTLLITTLVFASLCHGQFYGGGGFPFSGGLGGLNGVSGPFLGSSGLGGSPFGGYGGVINSLPYVPSNVNSFGGGYPSYGGIGQGASPYSSYGNYPYSSGYGSGNNPYSSGYGSGNNPYSANYNSNGAGNNNQRLRFSGQIYGFNPFYYAANLVSVDLEYVGNYVKLLSAVQSNTAGGNSGNSGAPSGFNPLFDPISGVNMNTMFNPGAAQQQQQKQSGTERQATLETLASYFANQTRLHIDDLAAHVLAYGPPGANDLVSSLIDAGDRIITAALTRKWSDYSQLHQTLESSIGRISYLALSQQVPSSSFGQQGQQQGQGNTGATAGQQFQIPQPPQFQVPQFGGASSGQQQGGNTQGNPVNGAFNIPNLQQPSFNIPNIPNVPNPAQSFFGQQQQQPTQQQGANNAQSGGQQQGGNTQQQQQPDQQQQQTQQQGQQAQTQQQTTNVSTNQTQTTQK